MSTFTMENPVFVIYLVCSAIMVLKVMGQGWMTVYRMMSTHSGFASPEDLQKGALNPDPHPDQLALNDYVDRSRRMHHNDLENIPAFWAVGFLFVATSPSYVLAASLMVGFVAARLIHAVVYATGQSHEVRATFYTIGSLIVMAMAVLTLMSGLEYL